MYSIPITLYTQYTPLLYRYTVYQSLYTCPYHTDMNLNIIQITLYTPLPYKYTVYQSLYTCHRDM